MADAFFTSGRQALIDGDISWTADPFRVSLVSAMQYSFSASHQFLASISTAAILGTGSITGPTDDSGAVSSADVTITAAASNQLAHAMLVYQWTGDRDTSRLVAYIDSVIGLPSTPDGNPFTLVWPHRRTVLAFNYMTGAFGIYEGVRGQFQSVIAASPCTGSISRSFSF